MDQNGCDYKLLEQIKRFCHSECRVALEKIKINNLQCISSTGSIYVPKKLKKTPFKRKQNYKHQQETVTLESNDEQSQEKENNNIIICRRSSRCTKKVEPLMYESFKSSTNTKKPKSLKKCLVSIDLSKLIAQYIINLCDMKNKSMKIIHKNNKRNKTKINNINIGNKLTITNSVHTNKLCLNENTYVPFQWPDNPQTKALDLSMKKNENIIENKMKKLDPFTVLDLSVANEKKKLKTLTFEADSQAIEICDLVPKIKNSPEAPIYFVPNLSPIRPSYITNNQQASVTSILPTELTTTLTAQTKTTETIEEPKESESRILSNNQITDDEDDDCISLYASSEDSCISKMSEEFEQELSENKKSITFQTPCSTGSENRFLDEKIKTGLMVDSNNIIEKASTPFNSDSSLKCDFNANHYPVKSTHFFSNVIVIEARTVLGNLCFANLMSRCKRVDCQYQHKFLEYKLMQNLLVQQSIETINCVYWHCLEFRKLFELYFSVICKIYGEKNYKERLISMIHDCEEQSRPLYYKEIINSLTMCDLTKIQATKLFLSNQKLQTYRAYNIITEIILDTQNIMEFIGIIEKISKTPNYVFPMKSFRKILKIASNLKNKELNNIFLEYIKHNVTKVSVLWDELCTNFIKIAENMN